MSIKKHIVLFAFWLVTGVMLVAQPPSPTAIFNKVSKVYEGAKSFNIQLSGKISYIKSENRTPQVINGRVCKSGNRFFTEFMGKTVVRNETCDLIIDHANKVIIVKKPELLNASEQILPELSDSAYLANYNFELGKGEKGHVRYRVHPKNSNDDFERMELDIHTKKNFIRRIAYFYDEASGTGLEQLVLWYTNKSFNETMDESLFSEKKYINIQGDQVTLKPAYKKYKLINDYGS